MAFLEMVKATQHFDKGLPLEFTALISLPRLKIGL